MRPGDQAEDAILGFVRERFAPSAGRTRIDPDTPFVLDQPGGFAPVEGDFSAFRVLPNEENPYQITRAAAAAGGLGLLEDRWRPATADAFDAVHALDADRDTNGAGLIYFANYIAFMNAAEQAAAATSPVATVRESDGRVVQQRRVAFYGNASPSDQIRTRVSLFHDPAQPDLVAARYAIHRREDDELICLSEAVKRSVRV